MTILRDYQRDAISNTISRWDTGAVRVPIVLATGLGKTVIFTTLIQEWLARPENAGKRVLVIAHTNELIEQAAKKMREVAPSVRVGIVKGALNNVTAQVVVSSRQTLASVKRRLQLKRVGLIVIDECHHAVASNTYGKILQHFGAFHEGCQDCSVKGCQNGVKVLGVTATLARSDKAKLSTVWEDCTFKRDIMFGIRRGYLLDIRGERVVVDDLNMKNVKTVGGDYSESSMADELERTFAVEKVAEQYLKHAHDRKGLAFWPLVATAEHAAEVFTAAGIPSAAVSGQTDKGERKRILNDLKTGRIQVVHNAMVLTEGFDEPTIEAVVIGRPTKSAPLYQQMVGRALRPDLTIAPGERRPALVLDVTGASDTGDLRSLIDLSPERPLKDTYDEHPDATLSELEEFFADEIDEEIGAQRAGASFTFESEEYSGAVTTRSFDPLGRKNVWGKTPGGTYYTQAGKNAFVFVVESVNAESDPGTYDVVKCSVNEEFNPRYDAAPPWQSGTEHVGLHLDMALSWAEEIAEDLGGGQALSSRKSAWRKRAPSEGMKKLALFKHQIDPGEMNAGELSEAINASQAARRIDPLVAIVRSSMQESNS